AVEADVFAGFGRVRRGGERGRRRPVADRQGLSGGRRGAAVIGDAEADGDGSDGRVGAGRGSSRPGVRLIGPVAVEVPLVFGDRAVGIFGRGGVEGGGGAGRNRVGRDRKRSGRGPVFDHQRAGGRCRGPFV